MALINYSISCPKCKYSVRFNYKKDPEATNRWINENTIVCKNCKTITKFEKTRVEKANP